MGISAKTSDDGGRKRMKPFDKKLVLEDGSEYPGYGFGADT